MNALYPLTRRLTVALVGALALIGLAAPAQAQANCETGTAETLLDVNNVQAVLYNIGGLFWRGSGDRYEVPRNSGLKSVFASGIWVGGEIDGELRFAGSTYGPWEYWPGPLTAAGTVDRATCQTFDRFWKVNLTDIRAYDSGEAATGDLSSWPIAYGAPFFVDTNGNGKRDAALDADEDGTPDEPRVELQLNDPGYGTRQIDLAGGERPDIVGDQGIWWVMNDKGGSHDWSQTTAIGLEVRALAFAFSTADALNNTTFYRYQFIYRGTQPLQNTYIGIFSDPDLGNATDDFVGSDPELGLGYVYNGDSNDENGYGTTPPALGYDFFQGPLVGGSEGFNDGLDNDGDGEVDEEDERLAIEKFFYFTNGGTVTSDPDNGEEAYSYMQGLWKDGTPLKEGGDGYNTNGPQVDFAFPGDPPRFWSEYNVDGAGRSNNPADRRFGVSSGPFTFQPGQTQEIVFGIIWSQAQGATVQPQIVSVRQLKFDDRTVQAAFNADFSLPTPPPAATVTATGLDQEIILTWTSETGDKNDFFDYEVESPFAPDAATDRTYSFEGFKIIQYRGPADQNGTLVATFDLNNNVTTVIDEGLDPLVGEVVTVVQAQGSDNGSATFTPTSISLTTDIFTNGPLRNGTSYYYGIQPYAVNEASTGQKVFAAPVTRVEVRPTLVGQVTTNTTTGSDLDVELGDANVGEGSVAARVTDPTAITGDTYRVEFFTLVIGTDEHGTEDPGDDTDITATTYRVINTTTGTTLLDGADYFARNGTVLPQLPGILEAEGLVFDVVGPDPQLAQVAEIVGGAIVDANVGFSLNSAGNPPRYFISANGASASLSSILGRTDWQGNVAARAPIDYELRFVEDPETNGQVVLNRQAETAETVFMLGWQEGPTLDALSTFGEVNETYGRLPFQVFEIFPDGTEQQVMAAILDDADDRLYNPSEGQLDYSFGNSDVTYDRIYARSVPYDEAAMLADPLAANDAFFGGTPTLGRIVVIPFGGHANLPAPGTTIKYITTKPNLPGDTFTLNTAEIAAQGADELDPADREAALDLIAITPNPYRGFSGYETSGNQSIARFVNLPAQATIRIFTLSGTLVRTIEKNSPAATIDWNLKTEANLPVASGMYLIHVQGRQADGAVIGERILKFGVIQRRVQLDVL